MSDEQAALREAHLEDLNLFFRARLANMERRLEIQVSRILVARERESRRVDSDSPSHEWWGAVYGVGHGCHKPGVFRMTDPPGSSEPNASSTNNRT
jgi:hypothetical protein